MVELAACPAGQDEDIDGDADGGAQQNDPEAIDGGGERVCVPAVLGHHDEAERQEEGAKPKLVRLEARP
ncbi:hypothetical protein GOP47_0002994 [Adiantum capillus-veneris]|uniref:Uncharacterized protein n=1 Tax=Adiantum capillus-veneris TaxID=13818 RepID=A0A9D4VB52_ADICA|nr:hypothetical protein GOP47_0002994 [Adiantum capillus-veneris]